MTLKRLTEFSTDKPERLARELGQFEENAAAEFVSVRGETIARPRVETFIATPTRKVIAILPDQQLSVDTSLSEAVVVFPALDPRLFGRIFFLIKRYGGLNNLVTQCQDPAVKCNDAAFPVFMSSGAVVFLCDSSGYYRR